MSKIKSKVKPILDESLSIIHDTREAIAETNWGELMDVVSEDPYYAPNRVERRGAIRKVTTAVIGTLAVGMAATGRRKWAAGLSIYAATQLAAQEVEKRISERRQDDAQAQDN